MESQPRAHLFKRWNNEFFVASHLAITINLAFRRYLNTNTSCARPLDCRATAIAKALNLTLLPRNLEIPAYFWLESLFCRIFFSFF